MGGEAMRGLLSLFRKKPKHVGRIGGLPHHLTLLKVAPVEVRNSRAFWVLVDRLIRPIDWHMAWVHQDTIVRTAAGFAAGEPSVLAIWGQPTRAVGPTGRPKH